MDPKVPVPPAGDDRVADLVARMTLAEKIGQLTMLAAEFAVTGPTVSPDYLARVRAGGAGSLLNLWGAEPVRAAQRVAVEESRLGIPLFFGFDVIHGHRTVFPSPLGEAAAFDPALWRRTARAAAQEAAADGIDLTFAPMLDVARDPRWGRIVEGPGEDPFLASRIAAARIAGFQGDGLAAPDAVAATAKHFVGYGAVQAGREYHSADLSDRCLHEVHLPPFRAAVASGVAAIMPAFQDLAGVPMTAHAGLLRGLLRDRWGFAGVLISDYGAVRELLAHGVAADLAEAAALALEAGIDIDMMGDAYANGLAPALERGLVSADRIDQAVGRVLRLKQRLGLFDDPYRRVRSTELPGPAVRALAREAACRSAVLLARRGTALPLDPGLRRIALLGPLAERGPEMLGPWAGCGADADPVTLAAGLRAALPATEIVVAAGVPLAADERDGIPEAVALAAGAECVILCLGEAAGMSGEAASRGRLGLPGAQLALADAVLAAGRPTILLLVAGRPLILGDLPARADAVLMLWHPGSEAGSAVADLLTGARAPVGRLPVSWPAALGQVPIFHAQRPTGRPIGSDPHFASRYIDIPTEPAFPFGHGLGYARIAWGEVRVAPTEFGPADVLAIEADLENQGEVAGEETGFLFIRDKVASVTRPVLELKGFGRLVLGPGERGTLRLTLAASALAFPGAPPDYAACLEPGLFEILVGPSADRARLQSVTVRLRP